jgi:hypothetical protein
MTAGLPAEDEGAFRNSGPPCKIHFGGRRLCDGQNLNSSDSHPSRPPLHSFLVIIFGTSVSDHVDLTNCARLVLCAAVRIKLGSIQFRQR